MEQSASPPESLFPAWPIITIGPIRDAKRAQKIAGRLAEMGVQQIEVEDPAHGDARVLNARQTNLIDVLLNLTPEGCVRAMTQGRAR
jgi:hypothetical protein